MTIYFHIAGKPISDCWSSNSWWNSGSQLWSKSFHLWYRELCPGCICVHTVCLSFLL